MVAGPVVLRGHGRAAHGREGRVGWGNAVFLQLVRAQEVLVAHFLVADVAGDALRVAGVLPAELVLLEAVPAAVEAAVAASVAAAHHQARREVEGHGGHGKPRQHVPVAAAAHAVDLAEGWFGPGLGSAPVRRGSLHFDAVDVLLVGPQEVLAAELFLADVAVGLGVDSLLHELVVAQVGCGGGYEALHAEVETFERGLRV